MVPRVGDELVGGVVHVPAAERGDVVVAPVDVLGIELVWNGLGWVPFEAGYAANRRYQLHPVGLVIFFEQCGDLRCVVLDVVALLDAGRRDEAARATFDAGEDAQRARLREAPVRVVEIDRERLIVHERYLHVVARNRGCQHCGQPGHELLVEHHVFEGEPDVFHGEWVAVVPAHSPPYLEGKLRCVLVRVERLEADGHEVERVRGHSESGHHGHALDELDVAAGRRSHLSAVHADLVSGHVDEDVFGDGQPVFDGRDCSLPHHGCGHRGLLEALRGWTVVAEARRRVCPRRELRSHVHRGLHHHRAVIGPHALSGCGSLASDRLSGHRRLRKRGRHGRGRRGGHLLYLRRGFSHRLTRRERRRSRGGWHRRRGRLGRLLRVLGRTCDSGGRRNHGRDGNRRAVFPNSVRHADSPFCAR